MTAGRPEITPALSAVWRHGRAAGTELRLWQDARLRRLVSHAYESVPFYRRLFDRHRLHPRHVRGVRDLEIIPFVEKADLRGQRPGDLLAQGHDPATLLTVRTSGSTGEPFTIRRTWLEDKLQYLIRLRALQALGIRSRDLVVAVGVHRPESGDAKLMGRTLRALGLHARVLLDGLEDPVHTTYELRRLRPDVLTGLPGMLNRLTAPELAGALETVRPRLVVVGGEVTAPAMRARLGRTFGAPVYETYGSHECPLIASECPWSGTLHACEDAVLVEVLRDGQPVEPGEQGEVVVTNLHAYAMPFIRYRIGDLATRAPSCACGSPFAALGAVQGRMIDYFPLPDGRLLHPYEIVTRLVWGSQAWIRQYQLVQERRDSVVLYVVAEAAPTEAQVGEVVRAVRPVLGDRVRFEVRPVARIPFEATGKLRPSRSLVRSEYDQAGSQPLSA
ncbi:MAG TPA: AMP-binding protein [Gemmatimonadales bacterium]|nr:AMP-binding protein [Gemmatimonadales bacterium]